MLRGSEVSRAMICPQCRSGQCVRSRRCTIFDGIGTVAGLRPWRCVTCDFRFYGRRVALRFCGYAHCPRCGNFDLLPISSQRVDRGPVRAVQRFLGVPAYRCDPCRRRFFSMLPLRRILPSINPAAHERVDA